MDVLLFFKVEEIVESGEIPEEDVHLPGVYVQGILKGSHYQKRIEVWEGGLESLCIQAD